MQGLVEFIRTLGAARLGAMAAVTAALVGVFAFIILRVTAPQMTPVFTDLTAEDSAAIVKDLERQAIPYELKNDGAIVMVPRDRMTRVRMKLAEGGLPKGGGVGYEIFDKSDTLGATSFVQNINHLRALEGELARTIKAIDRVQAARVHLVLPERPLFSRDKVEPSASIVLRVRGALEASQVRAVRHLVASAVNGLKPNRVSVVDEAGNLLADGAATGAEVAMGATGQERQAGFERRLKDQIESIVSSVVGPGRARVQLAAEFDFNRITETFDKFDPEGRVLRSSQTREESSGSDSKEGQVTVGNELPGGQQNQQGQQAQAQRDTAKKSEEIVNYEISRSTKTEVTEGGRIKRVSAAVLVDGSYAKNEKGESVYQPRSQGRARPHRRAGAHRDRLRPEARRPDRGRQSALCRSARRADPGTDRLDAVAAADQGRHHARGRTGRDGAARAHRGAVHRAAAGAPHPRARRGAPCRSPRSPAHPRSRAAVAARKPSRPTHRCKSRRARPRA